MIALGLVGSTCYVFSLIVDARPKYSNSTKTSTGVKGYCQKLEATTLTYSTTHPDTLVIRTLQNTPKIAKTTPLQSQQRLDNKL